MKNKNKKYLGLDSQCLSYLLDCIENITKPTDPLADEKVDLLRIWLYTSGTFIITETVLSEVSKIKNITRREFHEGFVSTLFLDYPVRDHAAIKTRAEYFETYHPKMNDCHILAEAEEINIDVMLSYDFDFIKKLGNISNTTKLMKPTEYWGNLNIPKGEKPVTVPHPTNPLSKQIWWHW